VDILLKRAAIGLGALAVLLAASHAATAQDASGKQLYRTRTCVACHGRDGAKAIQAYPQLAGQSKDYLYEQVKAITAGERVSGPDARGYPRTQAMKDVMNVVTDDEVKAIAEWLSTLPPPAIVQGDPEKIARGADLFTKIGCQACHGDAGRAPLEGFPIIAGQKRDYLLLQIKEIRDGVRKNGQASAMTQVVEHVSDADAEDLAEYLSSTARSAPQ
jgi:cytochrome c553